MDPGTSVLRPVVTLDWLGMAASLPGRRTIPSSRSCEGQGFKGGLDNYLFPTYYWATGLGIEGSRAVRWQARVRCIEYSSRIESMFAGYWTSARCAASAWKAIRGTLN